jgi:hypothetical protein
MKQAEPHGNAGARLQHALGVNSNPGNGTTATLITTSFAPEEIALTPPTDLEWEVFYSVLTSGAASFLLSWTDEASAIFV